MYHARDKANRLDVKLVLTALEDQLDCYRQLANLSRQQADLIKSGETARLLDLLKQRERQTQAAAELEKSLATFKRNWPNGQDFWSDEERRRVEDMLQEAKSLLGELTRRDEQDALALRARMTQTKREIDDVQTDVRHVRRINQSYAAAAYLKKHTGVDVKQ